MNFSIGMCILVGAETLTHSTHIRRHFNVFHSLCAFVCDFMCVYVSLVCIVYVNLNT